MRFEWIFLVILNVSLCAGSLEASTAPPLCLDFGCFYVRQETDKNIRINGREATHSLNKNRQDADKKRPVVFWNQPLRFLIIKDDFLETEYTSKVLQQFFAAMYNVGILSKKTILPEWQFESARNADLKSLNEGNKKDEYYKLESKYFNLDFLIYPKLLTYKISSDLDGLEVTTSPNQPNVFIVIHETEIDRIIGTEDYPANILNGYIKQKYVLSNYHNYVSQRTSGNFFSCATTMYVDAVERDILAAVIYFRINPKTQQTVTMQSMEQINNCIPPLFSIPLLYEESGSIFKKIRAYNIKALRNFLTIEDLMN